MARFHVRVGLIAGADAGDEVVLVLLIALATVARGGQFSFSVKGLPAVAMPADLDRKSVV